LLRPFLASSFPHYYEVFEHDSDSESVIEVLGATATGKHAF
jgi:hypothetical protein